MRNPDLPAQMRAMCSLAFLPIAATIPGGLLLAVIMGSSVSVAGRLAWLAVLSLVSIVRIVLCRVYLGRERTEEETRRWLLPTLVLTGLAGVTWSFAGTLLLPFDVPIREMLASEMLVGVVAIGFLSLSLVPGVFPTFATALLLPCAAWQFMHAPWPRPLVGSLYLLFMAIMVLGSMRITRLTRTQLQTARENRQLLGHLTDERDAAFRINDQLRAANETRSRFLGQVSHELRTPLTVILGYSELLLRDPHGRAQPEVLEQIRGAGRFLLGIVNDLLDLSSAEAGRLKLEMSDFSLPRLLDEVVAELRVHPEARDLRISSRLDARVPGWIRSDRGRIHQLLLNLGANGLRFTPAGSVGLALRLDETGEGMLRLRGEVTDTGLGLTREQQARLFQPFTRITGQAGRPAGGAGLGLAICRSIVEQMGGAIGVQSTPAQGSTFWFELPVTPAGEAAAERRAGDGAGTALGGRVLVAEDSAPIRELLVDYLRKAGCADVSAVESGTELLRAARERSFDLLLVDRGLPGIDGVDAIRELRADERAAGAARRPIVVVTASVLRGDLGACLDAGADAVLHKPLDLDHLGTVLARWLAPGQSGSAPAPGRPRREERALVADDHDGNRELVRLMLEDLGYARVATAADGEGAIAACERERFDLLLLDWSMPGANGLAVVQRIRERERGSGLPPSRIVMVTGRVAKADVDACFEAGADACVAKPYTPDELLAALRPD